MNFDEDDENSEDDEDEYGHPLESHEDFAITVELYPYSDVIKREAIGITDQKAYFLVTDPFEVLAQDKFVLDGMIYRIHSIGEYEPMQIVISSTGESDG